MKMLCYEFIRSGQTTVREFLVLNIINSFSGESHLKLAQYAEIAKCSVRTMKRTIKSLAQKGLISIRYGLYKSLHIGVNNLKNIVWKPNLKKIFQSSKGPKSTIKRAMGVTSNIESNKEINKRFPIFNENIEEKPKHDEVPVPMELKSIWDRLTKKN
jgi:hypothetical protein